MAIIATRLPSNPQTTRCLTPTEDRIASGERALRDFITEHRKNGSGRSGGFAEFEERVMELGRQVVRGAIADELDHLAAEVDAEAIEIEGKTLRRVLRSKQTYMTIAGPVEVERWLYKDRTDVAGKSVSALDLHAAIVGGFWTPAAAKQGAWVVAQMTPGKAEELFSRVGNMGPSKTSLDRLPKELSGRWEERREEFEAHLRATLVIPVEATTVAVSLDGVMAPMEGTDPVEKRMQSARAGRTSKGPVGYKEFGVATLAFCNEAGETLTAVRFGRAPESKKTTLKGQLLMQVMSALSKRPDLRVMKIADAGGDNWEFLETVCANSGQADGCVDFFHACEHLSAAIAAAYGDGTTETRFRASELRRALQEDHGGTTKVIRALAYLAKKFPQRAVIKRELAYFRKQRHRMDYADLRARGLPIGSGVVEAACKTLVTQRLKLSGQRWGSGGAQAILTLRGWDQSDRFDEAWALLAATYHFEVHTLAHVIPIKKQTSG